MPVNDDYDSPWKEVLEHAFPEFMAFYFPDAHRQIDWAQGHDFHDTELRQVVRDAELGRRYADILARVTLWGGQQRWVYVHVEVQGQADSDFARRMFTYNYRLYDRHAVPVASLALLADDDVDWRPTDYGFDVLGCRHQLHFPVVKLLDWADRTLILESDPNPFALVTLAHLRTRATRSDPESRYQAKRTLVRLLYRRGWERQRILDLFAILDWMMRLTPALEQQLWQDIHVIEGELHMPYVTSIERMAIERGFNQGYLQGA
ncbi:MAG: cytosolic protein, partial [Gammaproteobacteria bacterium]|nr:cytosolic protein [Gammaproteobacteria bacterium]